MKTLFFLISLLFLAGCGSGDESADNRRLRQQLDDEIAHSSKYVDLKEARLDSLKRQLRHKQDDRRKFETVSRLISEYDAYKADSALFYVNMNISSPIAAADSVLMSRLLLKKADIYSHAGLFSNALILMDSIKSGSLSPSDREQYYANYCSLYQYMIEYSTDFDPVVQNEYEMKRHQYAD